MTDSPHTCPGRTEGCNPENLALAGRRELAPRATLAELETRDMPHMLAAATRAICDTVSKHGRDCHDVATDAAHELVFAYLLADVDYEPFAAVDLSDVAQCTAYDAWRELALEDFDSCC
jgi:hypothetical protein